MKAIILAAGVGSRMGNLAKDTPKCLLKINGTPILIKQIESLIANGITDISVVVGFNKEKVKDACKDYNIKFYENPKFKETGMLESIYCAKDEFTDDVILAYGDVYFEKDVIKSLLLHKGGFCLAVDSSKGIETSHQVIHGTHHGLPIHKGPTKIFIKDDTIIMILRNIDPKYAEYITKLKNDPKYVSAEYNGVAKLNKNIAIAVHDRIKNLIDSGDIQKYPTPSYLFKWFIENGQKIYPVYVSSANCAEIDFPEDLDKAQKSFGRTIKGILFDAEGIIYYRDEETLKPLTDSLSQKGHSITGKSLKKAYETYKLDTYKGKYSKDDLLKKTLDHLHIPYDNNFFNGFKDLFRKTYSSIKIKDSVKPLFEKLKKMGVKIAILTDTFSTEQQKWDWFEKIGLAEFIDYIICSNDTGFTKDRKEAYLAALKKLNLNPSEILFVGHQEYEMLGSRKAGVKSVSIKKGVREDIFIGDISQLPDLLH